MHALVFAIAFLIQGVAPQPTGVVRGRVHLTGTEGPAQIVRVAAIPVAAGVPAADSTLVSIAQTDPSGNFHLEGVPPGSYYIMAGYLVAPTYYPGVTGISDARVVTVAAGELVTGVDFALRISPGEFSTMGRLVTRIEGVVVTNNGNAIPPLLSVVAQQGNATTRTGIGPDGRFQLQLSRGEHSIFLTNVSARYAVESMSYGSVDLFNAPLKVDGSTPAAVRITLQEVKPERVFTISGRVTNVFDSYWFQKKRIRLRPDVYPGPSMGAPYPAGQIDLPMNVDGTFEITDVPPGQYLLIPLGFETSGVKATPITVGDRDVRDVEVPLPLWVDVIAHIRLVDENDNVLPNPPDYAGIRMELSNPRYNGVSGLRRLVPEGEYAVSLRQLPAGYLVKSITSGARDLSKTMLNVDLSATRIDIEVTLQLQKR